jgi:hypothetical protein
MRIKVFALLILIAGSVAQAEGPTPLEQRAAAVGEKFAGCAEQSVNSQVASRARAIHRTPSSNGSRPNGTRSRTGSGRTVR